MNDSNYDEALQLVLSAHQKWLDTPNKGRRLDLQLANLRGADLRDADLRWADLRWVDLRGADLRGAELFGADLPDAIGAKGGKAE